MKRQRMLFISLACLILGLSILSCGREGATPPTAAESEPRAMATPDRLAPPRMPADPSQADYGAQTYHLKCMACHGDRGQGLTEEWRSAWSAGDQNCWQSKCHAANHPPQGFELPIIIPGVMGKGTLPQFRTAADLQVFICEKMPWYAPRTLDETSCWQLTAFLLRENGILADGVQLDATNADSVLVNP